MIIETQMRQAMISTLGKATTKNRDVALQIADNADRGSGKRTVRDWNAHLSMRTYSNLKSQGVMA